MGITFLTFLGAQLLWLHCSEPPKKGKPLAGLFLQVKTIRTELAPLKKMLRVQD
jgi:hypothetical protein